QPAAGPFVGGHTVQGSSVQSDPSAGGGDVACEGIDEGGLARAVRSDQPDDGAFVDGQVDLVERDDTAVGDPQRGDLEQRVGAHRVNRAVSGAATRSRHRPVSPSGATIATTINATPLSANTGSSAPPPEPPVASAVTIPAGASAPATNAPAMPVTPAR